MKTENQRKNDEDKEWVIVLAAIITASGTIAASMLHDYPSSAPTPVSQIPMHTQHHSAYINKTHSNKTYINRDVAVTNQPPSIIALDSTPSGPQTAGTIITWLADASDIDGDEIYYQYLLNGNPITSWSRDNSWAWKTSEKDIGDNTIEVLVKDMNHAGQNGSDDRKSASFTILELYTSERYEMPKSSNQPLKLGQSPSKIKMLNL